MRGLVGRGGTYRIRGSNEAATGFTLFVDALAAAGEPLAARDTLYLPLGHDRDAAARLRAIGWRTVAQIGEGEDAKSLGCTHRLDGREPVAI